MAIKEGAPASPDALIVCLYPDVCLAPKQPVPLQIVAFHDDATVFSSNVRFTTFAAMNTDSRVGTVYGDEGAKKGKKSKVVKGQCRPTSDASPTVRVNGKPTLRHDTEFDMNCAGPEGPANTKGKTVYAYPGAEGAVAADGSIAYVPALPNQGFFSSNPDMMMRSRNPGFLVKVDRAIARFNAVTDQVGGFFKGMGLEVVDSVVGIGKLVGGAAQLNADMMLGGLFDQAFGGSPPAWLPSAIRGQQTIQSGADLASAIWDNPGLVWDGITDPYVSAWAEERYGEALGRGTVGIIDLLAGTHGILKAGKLRALGRLARRLGSVDELADALTVARRIGQVAPDEFVRIGSELIDLARARAGLDTLMDAARKSGTLDDLLKLGKLTPAELDKLEAAGKLTQLEAARARAAYIRAQHAAKGGKDGVHINKDPPKIDASNPALRHKKGTLYRGDRREPDDIFKNGMKSRNPDANLDAATHQRAHQNSNMVSSSMDPNIAGNSYYTGPDGYVYVINQPGGIDVNRALGEFSRFPNEIEVMFDAPILPENIVGAFPVSHMGINQVGAFIPNGGYRGPPVDIIPPNPF
jgi:hypothetical protein